MVELAVLLGMMLHVVKLGLRLGVAIAGARGKRGSEGVQFVPLALIKHGGPSASAPGSTERARQKCPPGGNASIKRENDETSSVAWMRPGHYSW